MITCAKGGQQRKDVVEVCGAGEFLCRYNRLKCYLARSQVEKHVVGTKPTRPPTAVHDVQNEILFKACLLYTSPSPRDLSTSRMPSSA